MLYLVAATTSGFQHAHFLRAPLQQPPAARMDVTMDDYVEDPQ